MKEALLAGGQDGVICSGEILFEGQKSPWEFTLTEPVPEIFEFVLLINQKNIFLANQRGGPAGELCCLLTRCGFLLRLACAIGRFSWRVSEIRYNEAKEMANPNMGARKQYGATSEYPSTSFYTCVGVLWRTRYITIVAVITQWDANQWTGILEFSQQYSSINFHGGLIKGISLILITNVHNFYTVVFGGT